MSEEISTTTTAPPTDTPTALTRAEAFDALGRHAADLTVGQAGILASALVAEGATAASVAARVPQLVKDLRGPARAADGRFAAAPPPPPPPVARSNTGAPVRGSIQGTPLSILEMSAEDIRRMNPADVHRACLDLETGGRAAANPYRTAPRSHDQGRGRGR
jgi:hypothetical protein